MGEIFERRDMTGSVFRDVNLEKSQLENVNLGGAIFKNVNLGGAVINSANLAGLYIKDANILDFTISGIRIDELFEAELDRRDPDRASIRINDYHDPEAVREVMARLDKLRENFCTTLRSKDTDLLATRLEPEEWSPIEIVRHLIYAEDVYLNRFILQNNKPYNRLGLLPVHAANIPEYAEVGTEPTTDLETVLAAWEDIHSGTQEFIANVTANDLKGKVEYAQGTVGSLLQLLAHHDLQHIRQAEAAIVVLESDS